MQILRREAGLHPIRHVTEAISQATSVPNANIGVLSRRLVALGSEVAAYENSALQLAAP